MNNPDSTTLAALLGASSPGPWVWWTDYPTGDRALMAAGEQRTAHNCYPEPDRAVLHVDPFIDGEDLDENPGAADARVYAPIHTRTEADRTLIALARSLAEEVLALRAEVDGLRNGAVAPTRAASTGDTR